MHTLILIRIKNYLNEVGLKTCAGSNFHFLQERSLLPESKSKKWFKLLCRLLASGLVYSHIEDEVADSAKAGA